MEKGDVKKTKVSVIDGICNVEKHCWEMDKQGYSLVSLTYVGGKSANRFQLLFEEGAAEIRSLVTDSLLTLAFLPDPGSGRIPLWYNFYPNPHGADVLCEIITVPEGRGYYWDLDTKQVLQRC